MGAGCITIWTHGPVTCLYYSQSQRQTVKPVILYTRPFALVQSYLNPFFFSQKTNFQKNRQAIDAGNARLNKCKQNDLTDVIKGANTGSVCAALLILGYNPTPVIQQ